MVAAAIKLKLASGSDAEMARAFKADGPATFAHRYPLLSRAISNQIAAQRSRVVRQWAASGGRRNASVRAAREAEALVTRVSIPLLLRLKLSLVRNPAYWRLGRRRLRNRARALLWSHGRSAPISRKR